MSRHVRMARSVGRPSRRKKLPGMRPAAYIRSSTSTVRGKKSMPSRMLRAPLAVTRTSVLPRRASTEPWLWKASLPVSKVRGVSMPVRDADTTMGSAMWLHSFPADPPPDRAAGPVPSRQPPHRSVSITGDGDWQLTFTLPVVLLSVPPPDRPEAGGMAQMRQERPMGAAPGVIWCQRRRPFLAMIAR